jgi:hypothetical protein
MRITEVVQMRIGEHEVTGVTRDTVQVGCQKVTREQVKELLKQMDSQPEKLVLKATNGPSSLPGSVYVNQVGNNVRLMIRTITQAEYYLLEVTPEGIKLATGCTNSGIATEEGSSKPKILTNTI